MRNLVSAVVASAKVNVDTAVKLEIGYSRK